MFSKEILVEINEKSWKKKSVPPWGLKAQPKQIVDIGQSLLLLGALTSPNGLSAGSPERYWACVRYFSACAATDDLRISLPFTNLDPHQRGILSDDFGVALSVNWLVEQLGGAKNIVDGRQFIVNMGVRKSKKKIPKVGPGKCPDFVIEDKNGLMHVLECKGTQSGRSYLDRAMATGKEQKKGIRIEGGLRGESLVIGVLLSDERSRSSSRIVVVDPEPPALTVVNARNKGRAQEVMKRLSFAKAINLSGFSRLAFEVAWPDSQGMGDTEMKLLTPMERRSAMSDPDDRWRAVQAELDLELEGLRQEDQGAFSVKTVQVEIPAIKLDSGEIARRLTIRRGISAPAVLEFSQDKRDVRSVLEQVAPGEQAISIVTEGNHSRLDYGDLFFSGMIFD
ncbi:hypothetical protein NDK23_18890 [Stenotrophomonas maltophilia]|uniref:hypothetical protein n=1 Tax=Stenotrophomonas maltophilia TaxID=40324 RepID=UPI00203537D7|nr:hypothetical protein [Stenotrophomonas maltophilia]USA16071.1 hypothetical protein NDK23_18890 [Stenotrophomonas maltophilia]